MRKPKITPMMAQYHAIKEQHQDAILLYRLGDFYELFFDDAVKASGALDIALTQRGKHLGKPIPMAGVPAHSVQTYLKKLIDAGFKVAVCEQMEAPGNSKGPVRREVRRVVTRGTLTEDDLLSARSHNFLLSIASRETRKGKEIGIAALDLSTGHFETLPLQSWNDVAHELSHYAPAEILVPDEWQPPIELQSPELAQWLENISYRREWSFDHEHGERCLKEQFGVETLAGYGIESLPLCQSAAGVLIEYCQETQKGALEHVTGLKRRIQDDVLIIDATSRRNLELNTNLRDGSSRGTVVETMDATQTAMGGRLLRQWINRPLRSAEKIAIRQTAVEWFFDHADDREEIRSTLKQISDLERLTGRIALRRASPRDIGSLRSSLDVLPQITERILDRDIPTLLTVLGEQMVDHGDLCRYLHHALVETPPASLNDGPVIQHGFDEELDTLRTIAKDGKGYLAALESEERVKTGIPNLKVHYHRSFGYSFSVTPNHQDKVPERFVLKQSMVSAKRYTTAELKEYEETILTAEEKLQSLEASLYETIMIHISEHLSELQKSAAALAQLDILSAFAYLAVERNYQRPRVDDSDSLEIQQGRHPVVELFSNDDFVANDTRMDLSNKRLMILTGPNMAGKSTYIRQVALLTLLAHTGSFIPVQEAHIGAVDRIFTRVGAADDLAGGRSTFMVEMTETAHILHHAGPQSLVILDEIGRGTSTFDGLSIAWAVAEQIHDYCGSRTLFATHYHELTDLEQRCDGAFNQTVGVKEWKEDVLFLRTVIPGKAERSYGIHVAKIAGLPKRVTHRANVILEQLESQKDLSIDSGSITPPSNAQGQMQLFFEAPPNPAIEALKTMDPDSCSPKEALEQLYRLKALSGYS
ncbi:MAG: DNA mismatch repair protein MutS [Magnetococcales bacterium]|nr:DNA mismatch repair protein MutS [Magnetococcales bacterium]